MPPPPLTDVTYLKQLLRHHGTRPVRSAGQNFLISAEVVEATLATLEHGPRLLTELGPPSPKASGGRSAGTITELGAGLGTLTQALVAAGYRVRAIEQDHTLAKILPTQLPPKRRSQLELIVDDLKRVDWSHPEAYQLVGNIPYNLSGLILRRLTQLTPAPTQSVLLVQREVADRLMAQPPHGQLIAVAAQLYGTVHLILNVPRHCFWPAPKVNSALIAILPHADSAKTAAERENIVQLAKQLFHTRRKQLGGTLKQAYALDPATLTAILAGAGIKPTQRPQELSISQWQALAKETRKHENRK